MSYVDELEEQNEKLREKLSQVESKLFRQAPRWFPYDDKKKSHYYGWSHGESYTIHVARVDHMESGAWRGYVMQATHQTGTYVTPEEAKKSVEDYLMNSLI